MNLTKQLQTYLINRLIGTLPNKQGSFFMKFKCKKCWDSGYLTGTNKKCFMCFKGYVKNEKSLLKEFLKRKGEQSAWRLFSGDYNSLFADIHF